jgi:Skp family chaperone for outer membrane proteins
MRTINTIIALVMLLIPVASISQYMPMGASIGVVDVMVVVAGYEKAINIDKQLKNKEDGFEKIYQEKLGVLKEAADKGQPQEELLSLKEKLEAELKPQYDQLLSESDNVSAEILKEILSATNVVAKQKGIGIILRSEVVLTGGIDITDDVIAYLNEQNKKLKK